jgi:hypothetical protein
VIKGVMGKSKIIHDVFELNSLYLYKGGLNYGVRKNHG